MAYRRDETYSGWTQDVWWLVLQAREKGADRVEVECDSGDGKQYRVVASWLSSGRLTATGDET